jgi:hypothetical protein
MNHLASKGTLYRVSKSYVSFFKQAAEDETKSYSKQSYGYGYHYNCNIFVRNCLRRAFKLKANSDRISDTVPRVASQI